VRSLPDEPRPFCPKIKTDQDPTQGRDHKERSVWYLYGTRPGCAVSGCVCSLLVHTVVQYRVYWHMFLWPEVEIEALLDSWCSLYGAVLYSHCAVRSLSYKERDMIDDRRPTAARRVGANSQEALVTLGAHYFLPNLTNRAVIMGLFIPLSMFRDLQPCSCEEDIARSGGDAKYSPRSLSLGSCPTALHAKVHSLLQSPYWGAIMGLEETGQPRGTRCI
jgi:hypothetical protein